MAARGGTALCRAAFIVIAAVLALTLASVLGARESTADPDSDPRLVDGAADLVLLNGKIITVTSDNAIAHAIAIKGNHILAVGDNTTIQRLIGPNTRVIQLEGKAVLPGFIDAHTHIEGIADYHRMLDLHIPPLKDVSEMLHRIKERASATPSAAWIVGAGGWGQPMPAREQVDSVAKDHPVLVRESAHEIVVNSKALELAHINKNTPQPQGSKIWKDPNTGEPTGRLSEMYGRMLTLMPKPSYDEREQNVKEVLKGFAENGVTTVYDFPSPDGLRMYQDLLAKGDLPVRLRCQLILNTSRDRGGLGWVRMRKGFKNQRLEKKWSGREDLNLRPPGPETTEISQSVDFSIHVSGASTAQTHVIPIRRSQSFSYGCPRMGAPDQGIRSTSGTQSKMRRDTISGLPVIRQKSPGSQKYLHLSHSGGRGNKKITDKGPEEKFAMVGRRGGEASGTADRSGTHRAGAPR